MEHVNGLVQLVGAFLTGGVGIAVVTFFANRKRLGAQTVDQLATTAGGLADRADADAREARRDAAAERRRANREATKNRLWWERADRLAPWCRHVMGLLDDAGIKYPPMPPLYPKGTEDQ